MARPKNPNKDANISVRTSAEVKAGLEDLARISRTTVSVMLGKICGDLVKNNRQRIANFRRQAAPPIKLPTYSKSTSKAEHAAPMTEHEVTKSDFIDASGGDDDLFCDTVH